MAGTLTCTYDQLVFNEIESRIYAVMAEATQTLGQVVKQSQIVQSTRTDILFGRYLLATRSISGKMRKLIGGFHTADAIKTLEAARPEDLESLAERMLVLHKKVKETLDAIRPPRYWRELFRNTADELNAYNEELAAHAHAFEMKSGALLVLSKNDQDILVDSLLNPPQPNAALREAFAKK
jgi:hypothetical protein